MRKIEIIPKAIAEKLEAHASVIHSLIAGQRRGAAEQFGYAFLAGRALLQAKVIVPNGNMRSPNTGFKRWVKVNFPEITLRTAENWMFFAESILSRAQVDTASSPLFLGSVEMNGQSHDSILQLVPEVMDGKGMMRFMRETRLLRPPERPRSIPSAAAILSPEVSKGKSSEARSRWEAIMADLNTGRNVVACIESAADLERYLDTLIKTGNKIRDLLKKRHGAMRTSAQ